MLLVVLCGIGLASDRRSPFRPKKKPQPGDWLSVYRERGQSFASYTASQPVRARLGEEILFVPVGPFTKEQRVLLKETAYFTELWYGVPVRIDKPAELPKKRWHRKRGGVTQYRTRYFLDELLPSRRTEKTVTICGITMADLYPLPSWNFVFGEASLRGRVGVWSFHRLVKGSRTEQLRRCLKIVTHEIGHTFGLEHCIAFECNMNGANSLGEMDRQPLHLCPHCLKKLRWNRGFKHLERYGRLLGYYEDKGLEKERLFLSEAIAYRRTFRSSK